MRCAWMAVVLTGCIVVPPEGTGDAEIEEDGWTHLRRRDAAPPPEPAPDIEEPAVVPDEPDGARARAPAPAPAHTPAARLTWIDVPPDPASAAEAGCEVAGHNVGSGLAGLFAIADVVATDLLHPDAGGEIEWIALARLEASSAGPASRNATLVFSEGDHAADGYRIEGPESRLPATVRGEHLVAGPGRFHLALPLPGLWLDGVEFQARFELEPQGFWAEGEVTGYLTRDTLRAAIELWQHRCGEPTAPALCPQAGPILEMSLERALELVLQIAGGLDARLGPEGPQPCEGAGCDAMSVCLVVELSPVELPRE